MALIAQLTDLHVCTDGALAYGRVDTLAHLRAAVAHLNALVPQPDAIVVTGDLSDHGTPDEYALVRRELDRLHAPYYPIPGNHDGAPFWDAFADRTPCAVPGMGYAVTLAGAQLVLLDTTVPGADGGVVGETRATWLEQSLPGVNGPTLLALHHPPFDTGIAHMDRIGLGGIDRLAKALRAAPPASILCGHIHRTILTTFRGVPVAVGPSPAHAVALDLLPDATPSFRMEPPAVLLHDVRPTHVVTHVSPIGHFAGPFPFAGFDPRPAADRPVE